MRTTTSAALAAALVGLAACSGPPWKTYPFQDKGFIASFPAKPIVKDFPAEPSHAATTMIDAATDQGEFTVAVIDGSASDKPADQVLSEVPDAMAKSTPQGGTVRLLTYTAVMAGPTAIMGRDFQISSGPASRRCGRASMSTTSGSMRRWPFRPRGPPTRWW